MTLVSEDIQLFIESYDELIWTTIAKLSNCLDLDNQFMYDIIIQRLPDYLDKRLENNKEFHFPQTILIQSVKRIYEDIEDIILVRRKSPQLIIKYMHLIAEKVQYHTHNNYIKTHDVDDVSQIIQEKLLKKLHSGQLSTFKENEGNLFSTFFFKVVSNLIKDIAKSLYQTQKNQTNQEINEEITSHTIDQDNALLFLVQNEKQTQLLKQLRYQILTYSLSSQRKIEICLKINTRLLLDIQDATSLHLNIHQSKEFIQIFGKSYLEFSLGQLWKSICPFINSFEEKDSSPDNHRKWYVRQRNQLVVRLLLSCIIKNHPNADQRLILQKINSERTIGKLAEEWLYELVEQYYKKNT